MPAYYFEVSFWGFGVSSYKHLIKAEDDQSIAEAISNHVEDNFSVREVKASRSVDGEKTSLQLDLPAAAANSFCYRYLFVELYKTDDESKQEDEQGKKNVFDILLSAQKSYTHLPKERPVNNSKDKLYNQVLVFLEENKVGFTPMQVETTGKLVTQTLTDTLWYLDPHWEKLSSRSISCPVFESLHGFFDWKSQKIKEPQITSTELDERISRMVNMTSSGFFLKFTKFSTMCDSLINSMVKYSDFLKKQAARTASNRQKLEPIRSLNDNNVFRDVIKSENDSTDEQYVLIWESLKMLNDFEPLFLFDFEPSDVYDRKKWLSELKLPVACRMYSHRFGNYMGNYNFIWKSPEDTEDRAVRDLDAVTSIKDDLPKFSTRAMRKNFINKYAKTGAKPAVLRHIHRYLTEDSSVAESKQQASVDERVSEFLLQSDCTSLMYDLRCNNGRPVDTRLDPFWDALEKHLENTAVVHERRHGDSLYMPIDISVESLIKTVAKSLPSGSKIPSPSWVSFNFWPSNAFVRNAMCYTGRYNVKYAVQQRMTRARHPDAAFAFHQFIMMKDMAVKLREESVFICLDDKSIVPIGEPGKPISSGVRAHHKSLVPKGATLSALDHDFHIHGAVPSVLFKVEIPENACDSFYDGEIHVGIKDKVFSASSASRHTAETVKILRAETDNGLSLVKPRLFVYTDGGPDHRTTYWSVQLSYIALFVSLDLDMLVSARTAPAQSYNNPAERCMSILNIALQNTSLERAPMTEMYEYRVRSLTCLKKIRDTAEKNDDLKTALIDSLEPVLAVLKQRFSKLKFRDEQVKVHDAATEDDIKQITDCLGVFNPDADKTATPVISCKSLQQAPPRLKTFIRDHCRQRTYTYQIRKCNDCWYCTLFPKRADTTELIWLPDPTEGPDNQYLSLLECYGTETSDDKRPSMNGKALPTEADKKRKAHMNAAQVRQYVTCGECHKRRVVYCRHRLTAAQSRQVEMAQDTLSFTCGSSLFPDGHDLQDEIFVREGLTCQTEIETTYYSAVTLKFLPICFFCGEPDILGNEDEPISALSQQYSIVRPICRGCYEGGKTPAVRNALKLKPNKKK